MATALSSIDSRRMRDPTTMASTLRGRLTAKTERQPNASTSTSPMAGPNVADSPPIAPEMPMATERLSGGNSGRISASALVVQALGGALITEHPGELLLAAGGRSPSPWSGTPRSGCSCRGRPSASRSTSWPAPSNRVPFPPLVPPLGGELRDPNGTAHGATIHRYRAGCRKGGRAAECGGLENRWVMSPGGSNPSPSAAVPVASGTRASS